MSKQPKIVTQLGKLIIGVTGNIATGKSAIMKLADEKGALLIDADKVVHELMDKDTDLQAAVAVAFGSEVQEDDGRIDRNTLGDIVFKDANAMADLEKIVHPRVRLEVGQRIHQSEADTIFIEAIKLLEGDLANVCHQIWVTRCPKQRQLERLMICRGMDPETATRRIEAQRPQEEKVASADVVIDTAGLMRETEAQFNLAWNRLPDRERAEARKIAIPSPDAEEAEAPAAPQAETAEAPPPAKPKPKKPLISEEQRRKLRAKTRFIDRGKKKEKPAAPSSAPEPEPEPEAQAETPPPTLSEQPSVPEPEAAPAAETTAANVEVRRARPSDIPSILLLIHRATDGAVKLKRADLLMALGERSYFIGQIGTEIQAVLGWNIENLVSRIDQFYFYPPEATAVAGRALLNSIEESAHKHICEVMVAFFEDDVSPAIRKMFADHGFSEEDMSKLPRDWRMAIKESQPEDTEFVIKVLRERVTHPM